MYPPPEAQLDRFPVKTSVDYPSHSAMTGVLDGSAPPNRSRDLQSMVSGQDIAVWSALAVDNHTDRAVLDYVATPAEATWGDESSMLGVSVHGVIGMVRCTRVRAAAQGHNSVLPGNIRTLAVPLWTRRIVVDLDAVFSGVTSEDVIQRALTSVPVPVVGA